jgi:hypothetical protein
MYRIIFDSLLQLKIGKLSVKQRPKTPSLTISLSTSHLIECLLNHKGLDPFYKIKLPLPKCKNKFLSFLFMKVLLSKVVAKVRLLMLLIF